MKDIVIKISSEIKRLGDDPVVIDFTTEGKYYHRNGADYLVYQESEVSGMEGSKTSLKFKDGIITMKRIGSGGADMVFELDKRHASYYRTPYGVFDMEMATKKINNNLTFEDVSVKGLLEITYALVIKGLSESTNYLKIEVL